MSTPSASCWTLALRLALTGAFVGCGLSFDVGERVTSDAPEASARPGDPSVPSATAPTAVPDASPAEASTQGPAETCSNGLRDGNETDVDCGGKDCPNACSLTRGCSVARDCTEGLVCESSVCTVPSSCKALHDARPNAISGTYKIKPKGSANPYDAGCEMTMFGGGFTLAMKVDGSKPTFDYDAAYWTTNQLYNPTATSLDDTTEAKLAPFHDVPFKEVALVFQTGGVKKALPIPVVKESLGALLANETPTTLAPKDWTDAVQGSGLQPACNAQGFSIVRGTSRTRVRIGILGNDSNDPNDCSTPDSWVGIGANSVCARPTRAGNVACFNTGPDRNIESFARVFVR